jgi:hypothetical protein
LTICFLKCPVSCFSGDNHWVSLEKNEKKSSIFMLYNALSRAADISKVRQAQLGFWIAQALVLVMPPIASGITLHILPFLFQGKVKLNPLTARKAMT